MEVFPFGCQDGFPNKLGGSAFLVHDQGINILVDVPPNINLLLRQGPTLNCSAMDLDAIIITHLHDSHVGGLIELIQFRMLCLINPELMKTAGYFNRRARKEVLKIYVLGFDPTMWANIEALITANCPATWGDWKKFHELRLIPAEKNFGTIWIPCPQWPFAEFTRERKRSLTPIEFRRGVHTPKCCGIRINGELAISGDTTYDKEFEKWLVEDAKLVFHEAGYAGEHLHPEHYEEVAKSHRRLFFYHVPAPAVALMKEKKFRLARKRWYRV